jgi:hypothetical protein
MATVNFSVPDDLKDEFNAAFAAENKSAVIAELMRRAVAERKRLRQRASAIEALLRLRQRMPAATAEEVRQAREAGRP